jgi:hypothetical protein
MIGATVATFAMLGLVLDGGAMLRARSDAFSLAGAAARAGAQHLDMTAAVEGMVALDAAAAEAAALQYLGAHGATGTVIVTGSTITVRATITAQLQLLHVGDHDTATFTATATVEAVKVAHS